MGIAFVAAIVGATAVVLVLTRHDGSFASTAPMTSTHVSPLDEAERILARRYAQAEISAEEYKRMLTILRH